MNTVKLRILQCIVYVLVTVSLLHSAYILTQTGALVATFTLRSASAMLGRHNHSVLGDRDGTISTFGNHSLFSIAVVGRELSLDTKKQEASAMLGQHNQPALSDHDDIFGDHSSFSTAVVGRELSLDMKKQELVTLRLVANVRCSELADHKSIAAELIKLAEGLHHAGYGFRRLGQTLTSTANTHLELIHYAMHDVEAAQHYFFPSILSSLLSLPSPGSRRVSAAVLAILETLSTDLHRLIAMVEVLILVLDKVEESLMHLSVHLFRGHSLAPVSLLPDLWTKPGGNKQAEELRVYRKQTFMIVSSAFQSVTVLQSDLEELLDKVERYRLAEYAFEVELKTLANGLHRLEDSMAGLKNSKARVTAAEMNGGALSTEDNRD